jgi:5-(carboxyamino)imidazole ribonucleotide mutase
MPKGIPVATFAIGEAGAANAGLFAVSLLANSDAKLARKLADYRAKLAEQVAAMQLPDVP